MDSGSNQAGKVLLEQAPLNENLENVVSGRIGLIPGISGSARAGPNFATRTNGHFDRAPARHLDSALTKQRDGHTDPRAVAAPVLCRRLESIGHCLGSQARCVNRGHNQDMDAATLHKGLGRMAKTNIHVRNGLYLVRMNELSTDQMLLRLVEILAHERSRRAGHGREFTVPRGLDT